MVQYFVALCLCAVFMLPKTDMFPSCLVTNVFRLPRLPRLRCRLRFRFRAECCHLRGSQRRAFGVPVSLGAFRSSKETTLKEPADATSPGEVNGVMDMKET